MKRTIFEAFPLNNHEENQAPKKRKPSTSDLISSPSNTLHFSDIPDEVMVKIFSYFSIFELYYTIRLVCERWHGLAMDYKLWKVISIPDDTPFDDVRLWLKSALKLKYLTIYYRTDIEKILLQVRINCMELQVLEIINFIVPHQKTISTNLLRNLLSKCQKLKIISFFGSGSPNRFFFRAIVRKNNGHIKRQVYTEPLSIKRLLRLLSSLQGQHSADYKHFKDIRTFHSRLYLIGCKWKSNTYPKNYLNVLRNLIKFTVL
ncbi:uncharacterized protein LOC108739697 [Agrilus planipennis]|uniref:Uncharacterized protein LOC108739697 n=1 Tax=Agrilus planipennis TaxID=224129 RepID=A0A1W4WZ98_AGRPL|nr:uncharacterized protein LOC108739697 [Agrilus planipennis]